MLNPIKISYLQKFSILRMWPHLKDRRKYQLILLSFLVLFSALSEAISLSAIIPLLSFVSDSKSVYEIEIINRIINYLNITNSTTIFQLVILIFAVSNVIASSIRILTVHFTYKLSNIIGHDISRQIFNNYLNQSYAKHLKLDSNKLLASLTEYLHKTIKVLVSVISFLTNSTITLFLLVALFLINFNAALISTLFFTFTYLYISKLTKRILKFNSKKTDETTKGLYRIIRNSYFLMREIKIDKNVKRIYSNEHRGIDYSLRKARASSYFFTNSPRYLVEMLIVITLCFFIYFLQINNDTQSTIPIIGAFAMASQKLLPALQRIYLSWAAINIEDVPLSNVVKLLEISSNINKRKIKKLSTFDSPITNFKDEIFFDNVSFAYNKNSEFDLKNINFSLRKGERLGIIGESGSGKSTLIDLLLNLLEPDIGTITIDGEKLSKRLTPNIFSIVPQDPFIKEGTFSENIAFGINKKEINYKQIRIAAKFANIKNFIENKPNSYETYIGEFGSELSGGQKQRIAIARAFYKDPQIIVFDEATNALDKNNAKKIINELFNLPRNYSLVIISHDNNDVKNCDRIIKLNKGEIEKIGTPNQVLGEDEKK